MKVLLVAVSLLLLSGCAGQSSPSTAPNYVVLGGGWQDLCSMMGGKFNNAPTGTCTF